MKTDINHDLTNVRDANLCREARRRSGLQLNEVAGLVGVSRISILAWERRMDRRLIDFWHGRGFCFPTPENQMLVVSERVGLDRTVHVGRPIVDEGVKAGWSDLLLVRSDNDTGHLLEHEYVVDEDTGTYRFSPLLHGSRGMVIRYRLR